MPPTELTRLDGIELARAGRWGTLTGVWDAKPGDFTAAVEAAACPATRNPIIKLGHLDRRFTPHEEMPTFDGTPSIGWVENLRADRDVLYGDLVGIPQWLRTVAASAFPNRSIEAAYNRRCAAGHLHPFSIGAVALLGVTPPGVDSLRSLNDIPALFGIAAEGFADADAGEVVVATITADGPIAAAGAEHTGAMVALLPSAEDAQRLAVDGGEPADQLHVTLTYLGDAAELPTKVRARIVDAVSRALAAFPPVEADGFAASMFNPGGDEPCVVLGISGEAAADVHDVVAPTVRSVALASNVDLPDQHEPWIPHVTLAYTGDVGRLADVVARVGPVVFDRVRVVFAEDATDIPLTAVGWDDGDWNAARWDTSQWDDAMVAAAGGDTSKVDRDQLKRYWTKDPRGLAKWIKSPHPWRALYRHLRKFMNDEMAKRVTSQWYHDTLGRWPGERKKGGTVAASDESATVLDTPAPPDPSPPAEPAPPGGPPPEEEPVETPPDEGGVPASNPEETPSAELVTEDTEPKEGGVSTLMSDVRSRLGLPEDADEAAVLTALDGLKQQADKPTEPTPDQVAASAAKDAENEELRKEVTVLASQMQQVTAELSAAKAEKATAVKASVIQEAVDKGRIAPADRERWAKDYDDAPAVITRVLASIAPYTAVPMAPAGYTGTGDEQAGGSFDADYEKHFRSTEKAGAN